MIIFSNDKFNNLINLYVKAQCVPITFGMSLTHKKQTVIKLLEVLKYLF